MNTKAWIPLICLAASALYGRDDAQLKRRASELFPEAQAIRRTLHQMPELCFCEVQTAQFVGDYLKKLGLEVTRIGKTGLKAVLRGSRPTPVIAIRSDMDALPITEATGYPFASKNAGAMHACGHDFHMTGLLITAKMLSEVRSRLPGTVVFLFQACEEGAPPGQTGGAEELVAGGALRAPDVDAIISLHVYPDLPTGQVGLRPGPIMANADTIEIRILGKASHGAFPHQGIDAIYVAAVAIEQFQALISRRKDPGEKAVLTIGMIQGGVRENVIAAEVTMKGTVRTFSRLVQQQIKSGIENILKGLELAFGIRYQYTFTIGNAFVDNDPDLTAFWGDGFRRLLGADHVITVEPQTIAEDFYAYANRVPALYFFLGVGQGAAPAPLHSSTFTPDEEALRLSPLLFCNAVQRALAAPAIIAKAQQRLRAAR
jgi:amidohydrolase